MAPSDTVRPVVAALVALAAVAIVLLPHTSKWFPTLVLLAVTLWLPRNPPPPDRSIIAAAFCWGMIGLASLTALLWPIPQVFALAVTGAVLWWRGWELPDWFGPPRPDRIATVLAIVLIPLTTMALVAFIVSGRTDLESATRGLHGRPAFVLPLIGLGFVLANPTVEEILFRGLLQTMATDVWKRPAVGVGVQALCFGAIHLDGVPGGPLGMGMATGWAVMLGIVRYRTASIRLVWFVHVLANVAIFATVVLLALDRGVL